MKPIRIQLLIFLFACNVSYAQILIDSNLPIVIIKTDGGVVIPDNPRALASMKIIQRGNGLRNYLTDQDSLKYLNYNGRIEIEIRGSSSQSVPKKQYGFSTLKADNLTNNNVKLLGLPSDNDWILNGLAFEPSLIRDYLNYNLSRRMGQYASRTVYCEVVINGSYNGLYVLQEKIKQGSNRIDVTKIEKTDNTYPNLTGGYITKSDKTTGGDPVAWTTSSYQGLNDVVFIHELPKNENVTPSQNTYIKNEFEKLSFAAGKSNSSIENGFPSIIDIPSFIDFMLINEFAANADAYQFSTYYHKDRNGKLRAGPIWDLNLTYGYDLSLWGFDRSKYNTWQFANGDNTGPRFWKDLFSNSQFKCYLSSRFNQLIQPGQLLNYSTVEAFIDSTVTTISEATIREQSRWGTVPSLTNEINKIKDFIKMRIPWMTSQLGPYNECSNIEIPSLVITKIMYNPATSIGFPDADKMEFIEITNTGDMTVNLSGLNFSGTGFVYQFPQWSVIMPGTSIYLAGNSEVFRAKYGVSPFGQFTRNLNAAGEKLVLADAWGNVIDQVKYSNDPPWPDANGNGKYLALTNYLSDNSIGENWSAIGDQIVGLNDVDPEQFFRYYPSPVSDKLVIETSGNQCRVELLDLNGRLVHQKEIERDMYIIDMTACPAGVYLLRVYTGGKSMVNKIIKI
jgi:hypothetical protein